VIEGRFHVTGTRMTGGRRPLRTALVTGLATLLVVAAAA
jgi:hypothetical protein